MCTAQGRHPRPSARRRRGGGGTCACVIHVPEACAMHFTRTKGAGVASFLRAAAVGICTWHWRGREGGQMSTGRRRRGGGSTGPPPPPTHCRPRCKGRLDKAYCHVARPQSSDQHHDHNSHSTRHRHWTGPQFCRWMAGDGGPPHPNPRPLPLMNEGRRAAPQWGLARLPSDRPPPPHPGPRALRRRLRPFGASEDFAAGRCGLRPPAKARMPCQSQSVPPTVERPAQPQP